jgi:hypothetical protein
MGNRDHNRRRSTVLIDVSVENLVAQLATLWLIAGRRNRAGARMCASQA